MTIDVSSHGTTIVLKTSSTYPAGLVLSYFAADQQPWEIEPNEVIGVKMGINGDMTKYATCHPVNLMFSLIPNSPDDIAMKLLLARNKAGRGKSSALDDISLVIVTPSLKKPLVVSDGVLRSGNFGAGASNDGSLEGQRYQLSFGSVEI